MSNWFWFAELAFALVAYVVLGGFDIGVEMLTAFAGSKRDEMVASISPVWDGNGTWLVIAGTILFGAFPLVYSIALPALYVPLSAMLVGLVMRGVALEFRHKAVSSRWVWDLLLFVGSLLTALTQGICVGTYARGLPVEHLHYAGNGFEWCAVFPVLCGVGLALGYLLLGAGWLVLKGQGDLHYIGQRSMRDLTPLALLVAALILALTLLTEPTVQTRWIAHPVLFVLPVIGLLALARAPYAAKHGGRAAYIWVGMGCISMVLMLAASYLPYIVPFDVTLSAAAAPSASQSFMFWGAGLFVLPVIVLYTYVAYAVFRGKVSQDHFYH